mmetsp:Transcript_104534/g.327069  ORF Transcript_104534/g.327069 Transcript_104534/m.327069 type:complete len:224 (-) Transcript_104534:1633-2304(-)
MPSRCRLASSQATSSAGSSASDHAAGCRCSRSGLGSSPSTTTQAWSPHPEPRPASPGVFCCCPRQARVRARVPACGRGRRPASEVCPARPQSASCSSCAGSSWMLGTTCSFGAGRPLAELPALVWRPKPGRGTFSRPMGETPRAKGMSCSGSDPWSQGLHCRSRMIGAMSASMSSSSLSFVTPSSNLSSPSVKKCTRRTLRMIIRDAMKKGKTTAVCFTADSP